MRLVNKGPVVGEYVEINTDSKIEGVDFKYRNGDYKIVIDGYFGSEKFEIFVSEFAVIIDLSVINSAAIENTYLYHLKKLKKLDIHFYSDVPTIVDFSKIVPLEKLGFNYYKKHIKNLNTQSKLRELVISDFDSKDLSPIQELYSILSFRTIGGKLKSLAGVEKLEKLKVLEFSAHRSLTDISQISSLKKLKYIEINSCWKLSDFSPLGDLKELEVIKIIDCKNLASIKFVEKLPNLKNLILKGTTTINDYNTLPGKNLPVFLGSFDSNKYNYKYPEKEVFDKLISSKKYLS